jgi:hypothetical protein
MDKKNTNLPKSTDILNDAGDYREESGDQLIKNFHANYGPVRDKSLLGVIDALLKYPSKIVYEIAGGGQKEINEFAFLILIACMAVYGFIMGTFAGGGQLWAVPVKTVTGTVICGLICLPSLYIFSCLSGSSQSFAQVSSMLLQAEALCALLLLGFAPVAWIFSQATGAIEFMGVLHMVFWGIGTYFGLRLLTAGLEMLNKQPSPVMKIWIFVYLLVALQMMTVLRPLVGEYRGIQLQEKKFFITHWFEPKK